MISDFRVQALQWKLTTQASKWVKKIQLIIDNGKGILDSSYIFPNDKCNALYE